MSWNGSGTFSRIHDWVTDKANAIGIVATRHDAEDDSFAAGIQACITKNGESKMTAALSPNADASYSLGSASLKWVNAFLSTAVKFVGANFTTTVAYTAPTANRTITLPDTTGTVALTGGGDSFPSGTSMPFFQASAPTGWTKSTANDDKYLRVVSSTGGGGGGSDSLVNGLTITASHTLSTAEMPAHTHVERGDITAGGGATTPSIVGVGSTIADSSTSTASTGGDGGHTHNISFAPKYIDIIIAVKD